MDNYVLFSPLGMTDPTKGCHDGPFIHICRVYKPKKVYLYMSQEICELDSLDNRYEIYLSKLCQKLGFSCEVKKIPRPDLVDVHDFDYFYYEFEEIINKIISENIGCKVLLNVSSGTPPMKMALNIISCLGNKPVIPVQIPTPAKSSNQRNNDYDIERKWEHNEDNKETFEKRCTTIKNLNLNAQIKYEIIKKHVDVYDYKAAGLVAQSIINFVDPRMVNLIKAGEERLMLNIGKAKTLAYEAGYDLLPVNSEAYSEKAMICFEYILALKIKLKKNELADFVRAVSPVLTDLFELYLENKCGIIMERYYTSKGKDGSCKILSRALLPPELLKILDKTFTMYVDKEPCAANLCPLVAEKGESSAANIAKRLRVF